MSPNRSVAEVCRALDEEYPSTEALTALLRSNDESVVHAAVLHLERRLRTGEWLEGWHRMLPTDVFAMPQESQLVLSALAVDGFTLPVAEAPQALSPFVRLGWLRAALLARPDGLRGCDTPLGWEAVSGLPCERVIASGLLDRLLESQSANVREVGLAYLRAGLERGYLSRLRAHDCAIRLAHDPNPAIAKEALRFLKEPWTFAISLAQVRLSAGADLDVARELVQVFAARHEVQPIRRWLAEDALPALVPDLLTALGATGSATDIPLIVACLRNDPYRSGASGLEALVALKRRGHSASDDDALALLELFLQHAGLDAGAMAEVVSSRADRVVEALAVLPAGERNWSSLVALLESLGTRRAIERLRLVVAREEERGGWWYAIRALGRLGITDAEAAVLARLDDEADSCLDALRDIGGERTVRVLRERLSSDPPPVWLRSAVHLVFELDPAEPLFEHLAHRGLLTNDILDRLPGHGSLAQAEAMQALIAQHGNPLRASAIRALGRTGGPLAVDLLAQLIADPDEAIRDEVLAALRSLGTRLQQQRCARPTCLESSVDPGATIVADAILRRLRERSLEPDVFVRLLDSLAGIGHPHLVPVVRPYLRNQAPEVRKRVIACLGSAGPAAAAWILPWIADENVTVARQALLSLVQVRAVGLAQPVAQWLDSSNMNMKKTAAEALAVIGDRTVVPKILHWLSTHDNPGFRELLLNALNAIVGQWFVTAIVDRLSSAHDLRARALLIDALSGKLSASDAASLVLLRAPAADARGGGWTDLLLRRIYAGECALSAGTVADLDWELTRRGLADRVPDDAIRTREDSAWRSNALRSGVRLRQALHELPLGERALAELCALLAKANVAGQVILPRLSRWEVHALLDNWNHLSEEARAGAQQLLAAANMDAVARLRLARLLRARFPEKVQPVLMRCLIGTTSSGFARQMLDWPDREVRAVAEKALLLDDASDGEQWLGAPAAHLTQLIRKGAVDRSFQWSRQQGQIPELIRVLCRLRGTAFALAQVREWLEAEPALLATVLHELLQLGPTADAELERLARSPAMDLRLREQIVSELSRRAASGPTRLLLLELLSDSHAALRERAAQALWRYADMSDRETVLAAFVAGAFREQFSIQLNHADVLLVERAARNADGPARLRVIRLLEAAQDPRKIPLLIELWKRGDHEVQVKCRDALRALDATIVLPFLQSDIDRGAESILDVLGPLRAIPRRLVDGFARTSDRATWQLFLERMSGDGAIHAPGLAEVLSRLFRENAGDRAAIRLFVRLDDWSRAEKVSELAAALEPALAGDDRAELLRCIVEATAQVGPLLRLRVLSSIGRTTDEPILFFLMDALLENPMIRAALPAAMLVAVEQRMSGALTGEAERARRILGYRAARAKSDAERRDLVDVLEGGLRHASPRVRLHAHRLLRGHADRSRYLSATRVLLSDPDPTTVRSAIRVLAFGRHADAIPELAELLFHAHPSVRSAAREGLIHLGEAAISALARASGRARPDRRAALLEVLDEIERATRQDSEAGSS